MNIFKQTYSTPHSTFPFPQATLSDYEEALTMGMEEENKEVEAIINNPEPPTFANTIYAFEKCGDLLSRSSEIFFNLLSCATNDDMEALAEKMSPLLSDHADDICFNKELFKRVERVYLDLKDAELSIEDRKLLDDTYKGFTRSGINLPDEKQDRLREINNEMSLLDLQFSQNMLKATNAFTLHITDKDDLAGLPDSAIEAAAQAARDKKLEGWVITLHSPSMSPFMTYSSRRELRQKIYMAHNTICTKGTKYDNTEIVRKIVNLCMEEAQILGYKNYADFVLEERMAKNRKNVDKLLNDLLKAYRPAAEKELEAVKALACEMEGDDFEIKPWDMAYYSNKLQEKEYNINSEMLRPYFELSKVKEGVFGLATRLYGITFKPSKDIPVYNPDVDVFEVYDNDGSFLAVLYCDFHPRSDKKSGAWMTSFKGQWKEEDGTNSRPHVSLVMNFTKPTDNKPALLTLGEVETFLHEFGHSLHEMFADTHYAELSGTNVDWDFVELPSQFMENYSIEKDFLSTFATHYQTGEPIPSDLIDRIVRSRNFNVALGCIRQVSFALLDMAYYTLEQPFTGDPEEFEKEVWKDVVITPMIKGTCMSVQFSHIMAGGYSAGYYSYKWAEVLDADAFSLFKQRGIFDRETANSFRANVLSRGGTEEPMDLYRRFRGQEPTIDALLERNGIKKQ